MMAAMDAVFMECAEHGVQVVNLSGAIRQDGGTVIFSGAATTPCPTCGAIGPIIPGSYIKDSRKPAGPGQSSTLTPMQADSIRPHADSSSPRTRQTRRFSDQQAYAILDRKLDRLVAVNSEKLVDEVRALRKKLTRKKFVSILLGLVFTLGLISDFGGGWQTVTHVVEWATAVYEAGQVPQASDIPRDSYLPKGVDPDSESSGNGERGRRRRRVAQNTGFSKNGAEQSSLDRAGGHGSAGDSTQPALPLRSDQRDDIGTGLRAAH